jgi:hypothetical protein
MLASSRFLTTYSSSPTSKRILKKLTADELECVAQSSYAYWHACKTGDISDRHEMRQGMALREVARYLDEAKDDQELVFEALKRTSKHRKQYRVDLLRSCFDDSSAEYYENEKDEKLAQKYRTLISKNLAKQPMVVKAGSADRGVLNIGARCCTDMNDEGFVLTAIYMIERSVAATEYLSKGNEIMIDVVVDASCFKSKYAHSRITLKTLVNILQNHYPQRLNTLIVLDPPLWLSTLYSLLLSTFVDQRTRSKFQLARGSKARKSILANVLQFPAQVEADAVQIVATAPFHTPADALNKSTRVLLSQ